MKLTTERFNDVIVCVMEGEISFNNITAVREQVDPFLKESLRGMIVDLTRVAYLDSMDLNLLIRCHAHMVRAKGRCVFLGVSGNVERVFTVMKLDTILTVAPTLDEAKRLLE